MDVGEVDEGGGVGVVESGVDEPVVPAVVVAAEPMRELFLDFGVVAVCRLH